MAIPPRPISPRTSYSPAVIARSSARSFAARSVDVPAPPSDTDRGVPHVPQKRSSTKIGAAHSGQATAEVTIEELEGGLVPRGKPTGVGYPNIGRDHLGTKGT